jgi:S-adenosyl-L-methionine hydrolase (adenosine-forming)
VFAPVAAELAAGRVAVADLGSRAVSPKILEHRSSVGLAGTVVTIDRFGNLITDIDAELALTLEDPVVEIAGARIPVAEAYAEAPRGELLALGGSFGTLEIAVREGSAAQRLGVSRGEHAQAREARS